METTQVPINRWMDKQTIVYTHNEGWNCQICYNMNEPWKYYVKSDIERQKLYDSTYMRYLE